MGVSPPPPRPRVCVCVCECVCPRERLLLEHHARARAELSFEPCERLPTRGMEGRSSHPRATSRTRRRRVVHTCSPSYHVRLPPSEGVRRAISSSEQRARSLNIARRVRAPFPFCQLRTRLKANAAALRLSRREPSSRGLRNPRPPSLRRRRVAAARCVRGLQPQPQLPLPPPSPALRGSGTHVTASTQTPRMSYSRLRTPQTFKPKPYHRRRGGWRPRRRAGPPSIKIHSFPHFQVKMNVLYIVISNVSSS